MEQDATTVVIQWRLSGSESLCVWLPTSYHLLPPYFWWRLRQNGRSFTDDTFKCIFWNENKWLLIISLKYVPKGTINNISALFQIMAWHLSGDKLLSEPMMVIPPFHWTTIRSRSKPIWKSGPIGNKRELNGSDRALSGDERRGREVWGWSLNVLKDCPRFKRVGNGA